MLDCRALVLIAAGCYYSLCSKHMLVGQFHEDLFVDDAAAGGKDQYALEFEDAEAASVALEVSSLPLVAPVSHVIVAPVSHVTPTFVVHTATVSELLLLQGGDPTLVGDGAAGEGAAGEAPAASNSSAEAPAEVAIVESVFLAEDLDGLDDLPSDDDDDE